jgi:hypothetical protein
VGIISIPPWGRSISTSDTAAFEDELFSTCSTLNSHANYKRDDYMSGVGIEVLRNALIDAVERQRAIIEQLQEWPERSQLLELVEEQSKSLKETLKLFNRIT